MTTSRLLYRTSARRWSWKTRTERFCIGRVQGDDWRTWTERFCTGRMLKEIIGRHGERVCVGRVQGPCFRKPRPKETALCIECNETVFKSRSETFCIVRVQGDDCKTRDYEILYKTSARRGFREGKDREILNSTRVRSIALVVHGSRDSV